MESHPKRDTFGGMLMEKVGSLMLTDTQLSKSRPRPTPYRMTDGKGLYLVVTPSGGRLWRWKYRFEGREKLMALGQYPDVSLLKARERHAEGRRLLADGIDPMVERKATKTAEVAVTSFAGIAGLWLAHWGVNKSPKHIAGTVRRLKANVFPYIGSKDIGTIEPPDLVAMIKAIEARGVGDLAKRALQTVGQVFRYGIAHGHCKRNPVADIKPSDVLKPVRRSNMARIGASELPALLRAINNYPGAVDTRLAVRLMALTFVRTSELMGAKWSEIDWAGRRWNIPAERMKMRKPHIVPLASQTIAALRYLNEAGLSGEHLFPGMSTNAILYAISRMGFKGVMTGHGFRGLASTLLHEQGWPHDHIELQLAHAPRNAVSAAYNHALYLSQRAEMMQSWADFLEAQLRGK